MTKQLTQRKKPVEEALEIDVKEAMNGNAEAFGRLVDRHHSAVEKQIHHYSRNPTICEELVQDVFVEAFFSIETYRGTAPFNHWLSRIATRIGYRHWGSKKKEPITVPIQDWDAVITDGVEKLGNSEAADLLFSLLSRMKDKDRIILTLIYFEDLDYAEVAERMGWNQAMTRLKTHRARKRLKDLAKREGLLEALS